MKRHLITAIVVALVFGLIIPAGCTEPAEFEVSALNISPAEVVSGEATNISVEVKNIGGSEGTYTVTLNIDGVEVKTKEATLAADTVETVRWQITEDIGTHQVGVDGLSGSFKVLKPAEFEVVNLDIDPNRVKVGEQTTITVTIENVGEDEGTYSATLLVDGLVEQTSDVTLAGGATKPVSFVTSKDSPGNYFIEIGGREAILKVVQPEEYTDDFNTDTGLWTYWGSAYRDEGNGYVVLTEPLNDQLGIIWLNDEFSNSFSAQFRYKVGGGSGADGFVLMFYKTKDYEPLPTWMGGSCLAFDGMPDGYAPGYGIEFDGWQNDVDPSAKHIALIKDRTDTHLAYVNDARTEDNRWHQVWVTVESKRVDVEVDGDQVLTWQGEIDRTFNGIGFGAATGDSTNWHIIDDVFISVVIPSVFLEPSLQTTYDLPGTTVPYVLELANRTGSEDSFNLSVSGNAWPTSLSIGNTGTIPDGESVTFTITVEIPASASPGDTDSATITATSVTDPTIADTAIVTTTATLEEG